MPVLTFAAQASSSRPARLRQAVIPITINNGANNTNSTTVTLNLSVDNLSGQPPFQMSFSNNNYLWSTLFPFSPSKTWELSPLGDTSGDAKLDMGDAMLIAQYLAHIRSLTPEQIAVADANQIKGIDIGDAMLIAQRVNKKRVLPIGEGARTVYVKFKDSLGNWSDIYSAAIILDTQGPTLEITSPQEGAVIKE
ncbi:MAG: dockerin type I repeat-containing protein [Candidatus Omnitrophota bacterium]|nr:dockerin type I repeat-containing protein [Candidatus Omnitrophota bacterium]